MWLGAAQSEGRAGGGGGSVEKYSCCGQPNCMAISHTLCSTTEQRMDGNNVCCLIIVSIKR